MKKSLVLLAVLAAAGCMKDNSYTVDKLDELDRKADSLMAKMDKPLPPAAPGAMQRPQQPPPDDGPDEKVLWSVPIDGNPVKGPASAKVTIVEGADFACPFCRRAEPTVDQIEKAYGDQVRFVFKEYVVHPQVATNAALAACAADQQGKFWEMKKAIWDSAWEGDPQPHMKDAKLLDTDNMQALATKLGLDANKFKADMQSDRCKQTIQKDSSMLSAIGADGTPTFVINGHIILRAMPFESFKTIIDEEIKKADEAYKSGVKPEDYYATLVAKGKKG